LHRCVETAGVCGKFTRLRDAPTRKLLKSRHDFSGIPLNLTKNGVLCNFGQSAPTQATRRGSAACSFVPQITFCGLVQKLPYRLSPICCLKPVAPKCYPCYLS